MITTMIAVAAFSMCMHDYGYGLIIPTVTEIIEDEDEYIEYVEPLVPGEEDMEYLENIEESEIVFIEEDYDEEIIVEEN